MPLTKPKQGLDLESAIAVAQEAYTLAPEDGWRFENNRTVEWSGWRVDFVDRRGPRARRRHFLLYDDAISRDVVHLAIRHWFEELGR